jgi:hypothetical protein
MLSWVITDLAFPKHNPLLAPLTALLTVQLTGKATLPRDRAEPVVDELRAAVAAAQALQLNAELQAEVTDRRAWPVAGTILEGSRALVAELDPDNGRHCGACPFALVAAATAEENPDHC